MRFADIIAELKERYRDDVENVEWRSPKRLTDDDIERWITETGFSAEALFDGIAMYLTRGFHAETLSFGFCDAVVNCLNLFTLLPGSAYARHAKNGPTRGPTKLFWDVFLAFDAGEFFPNNDRTKDPVDTYTRPALTKILKENLGFGYPDDSV